MLWMNRWSDTSGGMQGAKSGSDGPGYGSGADVAVANPWERNYDARFLGGGLKLFPKGGHVSLQRAQRPAVITLDFIQQFLAAQDTVVVELQIDEQPLFGGPHVHGLALATGIVGQQAQRDHRVAVFNRYLSRRLGPPDHGTYLVQELPLDNGLDEVSISAEVEATNGGFGIAQGSHSQDMGVGNVKRTKGRVSNPPLHILVQA